ncbi:MAG: RrF2 family transcriptional regulator [Solirubrobacterales bacterium]
MRVSAKADYAVRAMIELVAGAEDKPVKGELVSSSQEIPLRFLENILSELRHAGLVHSRRGADGGYWLARPADAITLADVMRAVEGPLATVRGEPADELDYADDAKPLQEVWIALRANIREILETVTLADVVGGQLPEAVSNIASQPDVWQTR